MIKKQICLVLFILTLFQYGISQKANKKQGDAYMEHHMYCEALASYNQYKKIQKDPETLLKRGIAYYHCNKPDEALNDLLAVDKMNFDDNRIYKYAAQSYLALMNYEDAAKLFKIYLNTLNKNDDEWLKTVDNIKKCGFAKNFILGTQRGYIENVGSKINTEYDEYAPIYSPTQQGRLYFSSNRDGSEGGKRNEKGLVDEMYGKVSSDMYYVDLKDGNWTSVLPLELFLSTPKHEIIQDFSTDGTILYYIKQQEQSNAVLYSDTFTINRDVSQLPTVADFTVNVQLGDKDITVFNDSLILFASSHLPGYGGYDLFYSKKSQDVWQAPINFGPKINTRHDEVSPYLAKNGSTLFFTSNRNESMGGFDIFIAKHISGQEWTVENLGTPINSPLDESDIEISPDGMSAIFASNRTQSVGGQDLFISYFKDQIIEQLLFVEVPAFCTTPDSTLISNGIETKDLQFSERDYVSKSLYFRENEDIINPTNHTNLNALAEILAIYPKVGALLISHGVPETRPESDIYFSAKRAEKVADFLTSKGINSSRIILQGCGSNYPIAQLEINGIRSSLAEKNNRRIDVYLIDNEQFNLHTSQDLPIVAEHVRDSLWDIFSEDNKGLTFRVQLAKVGQMLKSELISKYKDIIIEKYANSETYTYTSGNFVTWNEALIRRNELLREKVFDAEIIPYFKGVRIEKEDMPKLVEVYPELQKYIAK
ncbi:MAG: OmpA family protein [Saprospiraceae bacterium]